MLPLWGRDFASWVGSSCPLTGHGSLTCTQASRARPVSRVYQPGRRLLSTYSLLRIPFANRYHTCARKGVPASSACARGAEEYAMHAHAIELDSDCSEARITPCRPTVQQPISILAPWEFSSCTSTPFQCQSRTRDSNSIRLSAVPYVRSNLTTLVHNMQKSKTRSQATEGPGLAMPPAVELRQKQA